MFPLKQRKIGGYTFGQPTFYGSKHAGTDYAAQYVEYYAPFDGVATRGITGGGGIYWQLQRPNGDVLIARHLRKVEKTGNVKEGDLVAITGNTGTLTTNPHLHQEVKINGILSNPDIYNWQSVQYPIKLKVQLVFNNQVYVEENLPLKEAASRLLQLSGGKVTLEYDPPRYTAFTGIPAKIYMDLSGQDCAVDKDWFIEHIWKLNTDADIVILVGKPGDWQYMHGNITTFGHYYSELPATFPALIQIVAAEGDISWKWPTLNAFVHYVTHEISHALFQNADAQDQTHPYDYATVDGLGQILPQLNYETINYHLIHKVSYERDTIVFVQKENDLTLYLVEAGVAIPISANFANNLLMDFPTLKTIKISPNEFLKLRIANKVVLKDR